MLWIALVVKKRNFVEFLKVIWRYYSNPIFRKADLSLLFLYLFHNPFAISRKFLKKHDAKDIYAYGETPLTTLDQIARECELNRDDVVYELGCGRGRTCFWLHAFIGCGVVGVDFVPEFIERGIRVKTKYHLDKMQFLLGEMLNVDYSDATVIYLYGTCLEDHEIEHLIQKFGRLAKGTKVITVSYSLIEYQKKPVFRLLKQFSANYTWGTADVYLQIKE